LRSSGSFDLSGGAPRPARCSRSVFKDLAVHFDEDLLDDFSSDDEASNQAVTEREQCG
jgi:hypothetical protein